MRIAYIAEEKSSNVNAALRIQCAMHVTYCTAHVGDIDQCMLLCKLWQFKHTLCGSGLNSEIWSGMSYSTVEHIQTCRYPEVIRALKYVRKHNYLFKNPIFVILSQVAQLQAFKNS